MNSPNKPAGELAHRFRAVPRSGLCVAKREHALVTEEAVAARNCKDTTCESPALNLVSALPTSTTSPTARDRGPRPFPSRASIHDSSLSTVRICNEIWCKNPAAAQNVERVQEITGYSRFWCDPGGNSVKVTACPVKTSDASFAGADEVNANHK